MYALKLVCDMTNVHCVFQNLFAYGNKDGVGIEAKLKHPLGVALVSDVGGPLLVADTYNSQVRQLWLIHIISLSQQFNEIN